MKLHKKLYRVFFLINIYGHSAVGMHMPITNIKIIPPIKKISDIAHVGTDAEDEILVICKNQKPSMLLEEQQKKYVEYFKGKPHSFPLDTYVHARSSNNNNCVSVANTTGIFVTNLISHTEQFITLDSDTHIDALAVTNTGSLIAQSYTEDITSWFLQNFGLFHQYLLKLYFLGCGKIAATEIKSFDFPVKALSFDCTDLLAVGSANVLSLWKLVGCRLEKVVGYKVARKNEEILGLQFLKDDSSQLLVGTDKRMFMIHADTGNTLYQFDYPVEFIPKNIVCSSKCIGLIGSEKEECNSVFFWQNPLREITIMKKQLLVASSKGLFHDVVIFLRVRNQNQ